MEVKIIKEKISLAKIKILAQEGYIDMVKAVVDIEKEIMAIGGEMHADGEALLIDSGSKQENLWGINIYPDKSKEEMIEFSSLINIRPRIGNRSMVINDEGVKSKIMAVLNKLIS